jgi:hypothetical protein
LRACGSTWYSLGMTTNSNSIGDSFIRFLSDVRDLLFWIVTSINDALPLWAKIVIIWFALSIMLALHLGPRLRRNREALEADQPDTDDDI